MSGHCLLKSAANRIAPYGCRGIFKILQASGSVCVSRNNAIVSSAATTEKFYRSGLKGACILNRLLAKFAMMFQDF
jgi:hypothetical protein